MAIDIHSVQRLPLKGDNILYEVWLDSESDAADLPAFAKSKKAANTSTAFIKSTGRLLALGKNGWEAV